jgi:hypothetical protein
LKLKADNSELKTKALKLKAKNKKSTESIKPKPMPYLLNKSSKSQHK